MFLGVLGDVRNQLAGPFVVIMDFYNIVMEYFDLSGIKVSEIDKK